MAGADLVRLVQRLEAAPAAEEPADWEVVVPAAIAQGLGPWLYRSLAHADRLHVLPAAARDELQREAVGAAARSVLLAEELRPLLLACADQDIPCAPVRGLALADLLYGEPAARPTGDLDVIVPRSRLPRLAVVLRELGFRELTHRPGFADAFSYTLTFLKDRHGWVVVEPHWTIAYPPFTGRVDMDSVWRRCRPARVIGVPAWSLAPEDLLLHLCLHLLHPDGGAPLLWCYEVNRLVRRCEGLDWTLFLSVAGDANVRSLVSEALGLVRTLFETPLPPEVGQALTPPSARARAPGIVKLLIDRDRADGREELATLISLPTARLRLRYALGLVFPSPEFMIAQQGLTRRRQLPLAYLDRSRRLAWRGARALKRLAF